MKNKKGFELGITTLILMIVGLFFLIIVVFLITDGFESFKVNTEPLLDTAQGGAFKQSCDIACKGGDKIGYCCKNISIYGKTFYCYDKSIELECSIDCTGVC